MKEENTFKRQKKKILVKYILKSIKSSYFTRQIIERLCSFKCLVSAFN